MRSEIVVSVNGCWITHARITRQMLLKVVELKKYIISTPYESIPIGPILPRLFMT